MRPVTISAAALAAEVLRDARRVRAARSLVLDVDGTLAPIAATPEAAAVPPSTLAAMKRLRDRDWRLAVVSGRPVEQVRSMVPVDGILVFGSHGMERLVDGECRRRPIGQEQEAILARWARQSAELAAGFDGVRVEVKPAGLAFHDRQLAPERLEAWHAKLRGWLERQALDGWEILEGRRIVEVRPAGVHKGRIVRELVEDLHLRLQDRSFVVLGDDRTDEDMFLEVADHGLGVVVGRRQPSLATRRLASPATVGRFLGCLSEGEGEGEEKAN